MSAHSLTSAVGIGSSSHDLVEDDFRILRMSPSDTGSKEDRAVLLLWEAVFRTMRYISYRVQRSGDFQSKQCQLCKSPNNV